MQPKTACCYTNVTISSISLNNSVTLGKVRSLFIQIREYSLSPHLYKPSVHACIYIYITRQQFYYSYSYSYSVIIYYNWIDIWVPKLNASACMNRPGWEREKEKWNWQTQTKNYPGWCSETVTRWSLAMPPIDDGTLGRVRPHACMQHSYISI